MVCPPFCPRRQRTRKTLIGMYTRTSSLVCCINLSSHTLISYRYHPFLLIVHLAYCKYLHPAVEEGEDAYLAVLKYMATEPVRVKLLRAVCEKLLTSTHSINTLHQHTPPTHSTNICHQHTTPTHTINIHNQHIHQHVQSTHTNNTHDQHTPPTHIRQFRTRFSKLSSKKILAQVCQHFRNWVHGNTALVSKKLRIMRTLDTDNEDDQDMLDQVR